MNTKDPLTSPHPLTENTRAVVPLTRPWDLDLRMHDGQYVQARLSALWHPDWRWYAPVCPDQRDYYLYGSLVNSILQWPDRPPYHLGCFEGLVHFDREVIPGLSHDRLQTACISAPWLGQKQTGASIVGLRELADGRYYSGRALVSLPVHGGLSCLRTTSHGQTLGFCVYPAEVSPDWMVALNAHLYEGCMVLALASVVLAPYAQEAINLSLEHTKRSVMLHAILHQLPNAIDDLMKEYVQELAWRLETTPADLESQIMRAVGLAKTRRDFGLKLDIDF